MLLMWTPTYADDERCRRKGDKGNLNNVNVDAAVDDYYGDANDGHDDNVVVNEVV